MKSFEEIERMVKASRVQASGATDERILGEVSQDRPTPRQQAVGNAAISGSKRPAHRRRLPVRIAAVVAVAVGLLAVLFPTGNGLIPESILFADVQKAMQQQDGVHVTGQRRCVFPAEANRPEEVYLYRTEKWASHAGYVDMTYEPDGRPILQVCYHFESGTITVIYHFLRQYYRLQAPEAYRDRLRDIGPIGLIEMLFQSGATPREPEEVQGTEAVGFEVTNMAQRLDEGVGPAWVRSFFFNLKESKACLWVDPKSRLPIHMQGEFLLAGCLFSDFETMRLEETNDRWDWTAEGGAGELNFFPEKPEGYLRLEIPRAP